MLKNQKLSLKTQILAFSIALGTLPVFGCGMIAYQLANKYFTQEITDTTKAIATDLQDKVNLFMHDRFRDIQIMANLDIFTDPKLRTTVTAQQKAAALNQMQEKYGIYESIGVFDLQGNVIAQTKGKPLGNHLNRTYIQAAKAVNGPVLSQPAVSASSGIFAVYAASTIKDRATGKPIGFIRARMPVKFLEKAIQNYGVEGSQYYLINALGEVFIGPEGQYVTKVKSSGAMVTGSKPEYEAVGAETIFPGFKQLQADNEVATNLSINQATNTKQMLAYAPPQQVAGLPELNWSAIIATDQKKVFALQRQLLWTILLGTGLTALLSSVVAFVLAKRTTKTIEGITTTIASSANEIASTVEQQERTVSQQASSVNETTTTMDELGAASRQAAEQAEASTAGAEKALALVEQGTEAVQQNVDAMSTLKEQVKEIAEQIMNLSEQTGEIAGISDLVSDLANQTNMLALNAAVEAARAGENGKGFAVVAGEIRKLADESKKSADKINNLVRDIQAAMSSTVMVTDEGTKKTDESIRLTQETAETFNGVNHAVNDVFVNSQQIFLSAKQQAVAVQQVLSAMNAINLGAQETSTGINQVKVSTYQLKESLGKISSSSMS